MCCVASETFSSVAAPVQYAAIAAYRGGPAIEGYLRNCRAILSAIGQWCWRELNAAGVPTAAPVGGFYLFPDFSNTIAGSRSATSSAFAQQLLLESGVAVLPGSDFGRPPEELTCRMAYVNFDGAAALLAVDGMKEVPGDEFVAAHCASVVRGTQAVGAWVGESALAKR